MAARVLRLASPMPASYSFGLGSTGALAMLVRVVVAIVLLFLPGAALAQVEKRIALLIGNQGYADTVGALQNPYKDIALVSRALTDLVPARPVL